MYLIKKIGDPHPASVTKICLYPDTVPLRLPLIVVTPRALGSIWEVGRYAQIYSHAH